MLGNTAGSDHIDSWLALFTFKHDKNLKYHGIYNGPCTMQQLYLTAKRNFQL